MTVEVNGIPVTYTDSGEGEVAVILQGWGTKLAVYEGLRRSLSDYMRVVIPALPGFGETPEPPEPWSADDYAAFTRAFLQALGISRCVLIGHSNGGRVVMKLVTRASDADWAFEAPKCVLIDSAGVVPKKSWRAKLRARLYKLGRGFLSLAPMKKLFPGALEALRRRHGSADYRNATPVMRATLVKLVNEDFTPLMPEMRLPTLLIWGEHDTATPLSDAKEMERRMPGAGLVTVAGAGHYSFLDNPALVYRVLESFLGGGRT